MSLDRIPLLRWLTVPYSPDPTAQSFLERAQNQTTDGLNATVAVLDADESKKFFGKSLARRGIQPVWLKITNSGAHPYRLNLLALDPNYYSPYEAAAINRFSSGRRLLEYGFLIWIFLPLIILPLIILLPIKILAARRANRRMEIISSGMHFICGRSNRRLGRGLCFRFARCWQQNRSSSVDGP